jgi:hypothetical protein
VPDNTIGATQGSVVTQLTTPRNIGIGFCPLDTSTRPSILIFSRPSELRSPRPRSICHGTPPPRAPANEFERGS